MIFFIVMLSVIMPSVIMPSVVIPDVVAPPPPDLEHFSHLSERKKRLVSSLGFPQGA